MLSPYSFHQKYFKKIFSFLAIEKRNVQCADGVIFMDEGVIVEDTTPDGLFNNPKQDRTKLFLSQIL